MCYELDSAARRCPQPHPRPHAKRPPVSNCPVSNGTSRITARVSQSRLLHRGLDRDVPRRTGWTIPRRTSKSGTLRAQTPPLRIRGTRTPRKSLPSAPNQGMESTPGRIGEGSAPPSPVFAELDRAVRSFFENSTSATLPGSLIRRSLQRG